MKAKCPYCIQKEQEFNSTTTFCEKCQDGYIDVTMSEGILLTEHCLECGFDNGGSIINDKRPLIENTDKCIMCDGETCWKYVGLI